MKEIVYKYEIINENPPQISVMSCTEGVTNLVIPDVINGYSVTHIDEGAFDCDWGDFTSLKTVVIPDSVTTIGDFAFIGCESLTNVKLGCNVEIFNNSVFAECHSLKNIIVSKNNSYLTSEDGILFTKDKTTLIKYPLGKPYTSYVIPDNISVVKRRSFDECLHLERVAIPGSVEKIESATFFGCDSLKDVILRSGVKHIEKNAFSHCKSISSITIPDSVCHIEDDAFYSCPNLIIKCNPNSYAERYAKAHVIPTKPIVSSLTQLLKDIDMNDIGKASSCADIGEER